MIFKLSKLNERQFDYIYEVLIGCVEESLNEVVDLSLNDDSKGVSSLTKRDCLRLLKKLEGLRK